MKFTSTIILALGTCALLTSATASPVAGNQDKKEASPNHSMASIAKVQQPVHTQEFNGAIRVIAPQKDLESAIRASEKGDILLLGQEGWYRLENKALQQGTKVYVLGEQGSMVTAFPKESDLVR